MNERKPRLDLSVRIGYSGAELGTDFGQLFTPFYRNVEGLSSSVEVGYQWTARNHAARGAQLQGRAQLQRRAIEMADLERTVRSNVELVVDVLRLTVAEVERSRTSLELYGDVVETEKTKFQLGMATLFDVIHAEEGLTRALVNHIFTLERHAVTLLVLRQETGTLVASTAGGQLVLPPDGLVTIPNTAEWPVDLNGRRE